MKSSPLPFGKLTCCCLGTRAGLSNLFCANILAESGRALQVVVVVLRWEERKGEMGEHEGEGRQWRVDRGPSGPGQEGCQAHCGPSPTPLGGLAHHC